MRTSVHLSEKDGRKVMTESRKSNFELCRIFAMFMIICHHFAIRNGFAVCEINIFSIWIRVLESAGKIGVNLFILLTGYFMVEKEMKLQKAICLILDTVFYSWLSLPSGLVINTFPTEIC